ncbi:hypothetical protein AB3S75_009143 [Citrus x aurantiifolia]
MVSFAHKFDRRFLTYTKKNRSNPLQIIAKIAFVIPNFHYQMEMRLEDSSSHRVLLLYMARVALSGSVRPRNFIKSPIPSTRRICKVGAF